MRREWTASTNSPPSSPSPPSLPSPVTWHVVLWVLFSLAINSMAQPSGRLCGIITLQSRHRMYLCSAPIICVADALEMVIRLVTTMLYLKMSPPKASRMVVLARSYPAVKNGRPSILHLQSSDSPESQIQGRRWPRWLFFIFGCLPAAIKVASFSDTPWTKTWGLMFAFSFVVIELIHVLAGISDPDSEHTSSVPTILGLNTIDWEDTRYNNLRSKITSMTRAFEIGDVVLIMIATFAHLGVVYWAAADLWFVVAYAHNGLHITSIIKSSVTLWILILLLGGVVMKCMGRPFSGDRFKRWLGVSFFVMMIIPDERKKHKDDFFLRLHKFNIKLTIGFYIIGFFWLCQKLMLLVCKKWPGVGRAFLIDNEEWNSRRGEDQAGESSEGVENQEVEPIEDGAWAALCLFITNVVVCALWYAFIYDPTETINPPWTDVFG